MPSDRQARLARLYAASALACLVACGVPLPAFAQDVGNMATTVPSGSQMLLAADTLEYNNDNQTVTAIGGVQIDYGGNRLVAQKVVYNRNTKRMVASGNVEIVNSDGTKINSQHIDITDDFADGFVNALRVETVDKAYFAAESAERMGGVLTTFHNGVYTACEPCEDKPDKAPTWRVKARKIIWNGEKKTVRFENANFEFFGFPLAYLPAFEIADPTVKRKSGFLIPSIGYNSHLGYSVKIPYYFALSPTYDLTVTGSGYTKQGFLGEAEWRQRFNNGEYTFKIAGIQQQDPDAFIDGAAFPSTAGHNIDSGAVGDPNKFRGMMGTQGQFAINERWNFGWDVLLQTDKNFSNTYNIAKYNAYVHQSSVYLTGLNDRNYFDVRAMHFEVQEDTPNENAAARSGQQPWVLPSLDYAYIPDTSVAGGQLSFNVNTRVIRREDLDEAFNTPYDSATPAQRVRGIEGESGRLTTEAEWKRTFVTDDGLVLTPLLAFQGDVDYVRASSASLAAIQEMAANPDIHTSEDMRSSFARYMATAGLEMSWPLLFSLASGSSHVVEPMAQVFLRPNEQYVGGLSIPNEDAQSMVFDATTLFERDKFSGYDRIEGGSRANVGLRYSGSYINGWGTNAIFGQSYQIGGENSFAAPDLVNVGANSGLETTKSDYVGLFGITSPNGFAASVSGRFDEQSFEIRRAELKAAYSGLPVSLSAKYAFIQAQPLYGFTTDRHEVTLGASTHLAENWRVFGTGTYDLQEGLLVKDGVGFAYNDSCFTYLMTYAQSRDLNTREVTQSIGFNLSFRTLGDFGSSTNAIDTIQ
ncbi:LPS-assembly protein LptD [Mesorhizobium sp. M8A.F.Ca.ET.161.01.1.1]|nr:LPS-assembly protein LptD [Mesorhizobium sp. M8A.F.Ca.ET.021.01.1.1]RUX04027.1 LPS-assembly protein LptD [Mesorhizobium sp. M8A.F.Ca.ET.023.01.1.1]RUX06722.1 LPS-assembly protein LptD [Mesorhizobium sp. M8A.F.Ca.ET.059.01.1.1]RVD52898.1 LPS-assembly protein LptD [Mesorhizobium sp. M8A.F.Ca.ET.023.02.2.1]RWC70257.1 MAG: LPS-assembly protein LptD [Mesorhizobium sp.]TGP95725.1 LPS-assembly protein LptD [Mesorhizobium sp. M8A.F.Ca.ET.218.01.1.1]TGS45823.1 LPS-assembly protein LptD [Mesorhizobi